MAEPFKQEMVLVMRCVVHIEEKLEGEELYRQLKEMLKNFDPRVQVFGQINEFLEPCCEKKKGAPDDGKDSQIPQ